MCTGTLSSRAQSEREKEITKLDGSEIDAEWKLLSVFCGNQQKETDVKKVFVENVVLLQVLNKAQCWSKFLLESLLDLH